MSILAHSNMDEANGEKGESVQTHSDENYAINKSEAVPVVLQWLENNFEQQADASIPKHDVYEDYVQFCHKHRIEPTSASAFGRLVRLAFPATTSRRLGARGANVTVYNNFRRREGTSDETSARRPHPSSMSTSVSSANGPPSPSILDLHTRLRGGSKKADGRSDGVELIAGRSSSGAMQPQGWKSGSSSSLAMGLEEEEEEIDGQVQGMFEDGLVFSAATGRRQPLRGPLEDGFVGEAGPPSSVNNSMLMKMLKEENGPELYYSLQRLLHGTQSRPSRTNDGGAQGMETEEGERRAQPPDASALQVQLYRGPYQSKEEKKLTLWNADTHLYLMKLCETYRDCYSHNLWLLNPLHPAALEDDNIRYIMCTDEGSEERSALSLSIYWILYSGALMEGHIERATEFYSIARDHLSFVFDQTDSSISLVLLPMAYHARFWAVTEEDGLAKCTYYLTLAMEICKRIGCLGSSVYISCLQMYAWFCMTDNTSLSSEEKLQEIRKGSFYPTTPMSLQATAIPRNARTSVNIPISHLQMVEKMFGVVGNIMKGIFIFKSTIYPEFGSRQPCPQSSSVPSSLSDYHQHHGQQPYRANKRKHPEDYQPNVSDDLDQRYRYSSDAPPAKYFRADSDAIPPEDQADDHDRDSRQSGSYGSPQYRNMFLPNNTLQPLLLPLDTMDKDLELLMQSNNPLPANIYMMFKLWILGESAECLWCMGQPEQALNLALYFLDISKRSTKNFISHYVSIQPILEMVLNIFLCTSRFNQFRDLIDAILEPLDASIPHVSRSKARYLSLLFSANPNFSSSTDIDGVIASNGSAMSQTTNLNVTSGDDSPELASSRSGAYPNHIPGNTSGGPGRPGNGSGSDESPPSYGNDSGEDSEQQLLGLNLRPL